jgi:hypothetical protein
MERTTSAVSSLNPASLTGLRGLTVFGSAPVVTRRLMQPPGTSRVCTVDGAFL